MSNLVFAIHVVVPLFMLIVTGYVARCMRFVSDSFWQEANRFVFRFPLPLMLFQNVRAAFQGEFTGTRLMISAFVGIVAVIIADISHTSGSKTQGTRRQPDTGHVSQ